MAYSITITNTNNKKFRFYDGEVRSASYRITTKLLKQSLPDADAEKAIIINLGREKIISFPIKLTATPNNDAAVATHSSTVKTVAEKVTYLDETFITNGIEDLYTIEIASNGITLTKTGILEGLTIDLSAENPSYVSGNMDFGIGGGSQ